MNAGTLDRAYHDVTAVASGLDDAQLFAPSRCAGWAVCDVLFHLMLDAQRALMTFATPTDAPADTDAVSYWRSFGPDADRAEALEHARFVRVAAAAYSRPAALVRHWSDTSAAAVRAARAAPERGRVSTQGHVLPVADFVTTLVVEAAVHHLDMTVHLPDAPAVDPGSLRAVVLTLDGLLGQRPPVNWHEEIYALKGTGRLPLSPTERDSLGDLSARFPVFG